MFSIALLAAACLMQPSIDASSVVIAEDPLAIRKLKLTIEYVELDIRKLVSPAKGHDEKQSPKFDCPEVRDFRDLQELVKKSKVRTHRTLSGDIQMGSPFELEIDDYCVTFSAGGAVFQSKDPLPTLPADEKLVYVDVRIDWLERFSHFVPIPGQTALPKSKQGAELKQEVMVGTPVVWSTATKSWEMSGKEWMHVCSALVLRVDDVK